MSNLTILLKVPSVLQSIHILYSRFPFSELIYNFISLDISLHFFSSTALSFLVQASVNNNIKTSNFSTQYFTIIRMTFQSCNVLYLNSNCFAFLLEAVLLVIKL